MEQNNIYNVVKFIKDSINNDLDAKVIINKFHLEYPQYLREIVHILDLSSPYNEELKQKNPEAGCMKFSIFLMQHQIHPIIYSINQMN